jgi:hypothetical protein
MAIQDVVGGFLLMNHAMMTTCLPLAMYSENVEEVSPEQLAEGFEQLGLTVHRIVDPLPHDRLNIGDELGLSPSWVIGHLALLFRSVPESLGEPVAGELPSGFAGVFGPGRDGTAVHEEPASLIRLFDRHLEMVSTLLKRANPRLLSEPPPRDDFGLLVLTPHDSLGGHAAAALRYAGVYVVELAMLCAMS